MWYLDMTITIINVMKFLVLIVRPNRRRRKRRRRRKG